MCDAQSSYTMNKIKLAKSKSYSLRKDSVTTKNSKLLLVFRNEDLLQKSYKTHMYITMRNKPFYFITKLCPGVTDPWKFHYNYRIYLKQVLHADQSIKILIIVCFYISFIQHLKINPGLSFLDCHSHW